MIITPDNSTKLHNLQLKNVLDVGANEGQFTSYIKSIYKDVHCIMVEPNKNCEPYLSKINAVPHYIALSNKVGEVKMYFQKDNPIGTGASIYKENTTFYDNCIERVVRCSTLDECCYFGDSTIDLLKLDTQGSELDIIEGGLETVKRCRYILIEASLIQYNEGAPLIEDTFNVLTSLGFHAISLISQHRFGDGYPFQIDFLFKNTNL